jgi:hypothetical protein
VKRNYLEKLEAHVPEFAKRIVGQYKLPDWCFVGVGSSAPTCLNIPKLNRKNRSQLDRLLVGVTN